MTEEDILSHYGYVRPSVCCMYALEVPYIRFMKPYTQKYPGRIERAFIPVVSMNYIESYLDAGASKK